MVNEVLGSVREPGAVRGFQGQVLEGVRHELQDLVGLLHGPALQGLHEVAAAQRPLHGQAPVRGDVAGGFLRELGRGTDGHVDEVV